MAVRCPGCRRAGIGRPRLQLATSAIAEACAAQRPAIVVGGSGLYLRALLHGPGAGPGHSEPIGRRHGCGSPNAACPRCRAELAELDPVMAARLRPTDRQRLLRAYEVIVATGRSLAAWQGASGADRAAAAALRSAVVRRVRRSPKDRTAPAEHGGGRRHRGAQSAAPAEVAGGSASDEGRRGTRAAAIQLAGASIGSRCSGGDRRIRRYAKRQITGCATSCPSCGRSRHSASIQVPGDWAGAVDRTAFGALGCDPASD